MQRSVLMLKIAQSKQCYQFYERGEREQALFFLVSWKLFDESLMIMKCHLHFPNEVEIDVVRNRKTSAFLKEKWNVIRNDSLFIKTSLWTSTTIHTKPFAGPFDL